MLVLTVLVLVLTRRLSPWPRNASRSVWVGVLIGIAIGVIRFAARVVKQNPDINPVVPGVLHLVAIAEFVEAFFVSTFVWLPYVFDALERSSTSLFLAVRQ